VDWFHLTQYRDISLVFRAHGREPFATVRGHESLGSVSDCQFLKKDFCKGKFFSLINRIIVTMQ